MGGGERQRARVEHPRCPYCRDDVRPSDAKTACDACMAWHHQGCWSEHGVCSACGAGERTGEGLPSAPSPCRQPGCPNPALAATIEPTRVKGVDLRDRCLEHARAHLQSARSEMRVALGLLVAVGLVFLGYGLFFAPAEVPPSSEQLTATQAILLAVCSLFGSGVAWVLGGAYYAAGAGRLAALERPPRAGAGDDGKRG